MVDTAPRPDRPQQHRNGPTPALDLADARSGWRLSAGSMLARQGISSKARMGPFQKDRGGWSHRAAGLQRMAGSTVVQIEYGQVMPHCCCRGPISWVPIGFGSFQGGRVSLRWAQVGGPKRFRWRGGRPQAGRPDMGGSTARLNLMRPVMSYCPCRWLQALRVPSFPGHGSGMEARMEALEVEPGDDGREGAPASGSSIQGRVDGRL